MKGEKHAVLHQLEDALGIRFTLAPHPDVVYASYDVFGINEVRALTDAAQRKPIEREELRLIVDAESITLEAQNALLKLTEDPPRYARFVFVFPRELSLIPTFRSRVIEVMHTADEKADLVVLCDGTIGEQLGDIATWTKNGEQEKISTYIAQAEHEVREVPATSYARALSLSRRFIGVRGASAKMLLEHLTLTRAESKLKR